ncbi:MAG: hypothetical protein COB02_05750 [Candidatus Cloacimonadota bacterium]|nr:MAG: hypothetical protein COB02_05750 [Candidatus Cloacimonadota bacterium]
MTDLIKLDFFQKGLDCFNKKQFFEAHEEWEQIWLKCTFLDEKLFFQSLILLAGVGVHLQKNRLPAANRLIVLGKKKLLLISNNVFSMYAHKLNILFEAISESFTKDNFKILFTPFLVDYSI